MVIFWFKSVHFNRYLLHCGINSTDAKFKARTKTNITQKTVQMHEHKTLKRPKKWQGRTKSTIDYVQGQTLEMHKNVDKLILKSHRLV